jgi:hypothetical protein
MTDKSSLRDKARDLRALGKTYSQVTKALGVPVAKSTLSYWCRGLSLSEDYEANVQKLVKAGSSRGRAAALVSNRRKYREARAAIKKRAHGFSPLLADVRVGKLALAMLYLGEGAKWVSHRGLALGSSDPDIVKLYVQLLESCYGIKRRALKARIMYRSDQDIATLTGFWSKQLHLTSGQFYKTKPDSRTSGIRTRKNNYKGVCAIYCAGTEIQLELDAIARSLINGD